MTNYVFDEDRIIKELKEYIDATYSEHYASKGRIQVTEFIQSQLDTPDFFRGNVLKYTARYGHKDGSNRKDLMKAMHYLVMLLSWHDKKFAELKIETPAPTKMFHLKCDAKDIKPENDGTLEKFDPANTTWKTDKYYGGNGMEIANSVPVSDVLVQNVYIQMAGGKIGQMQNGVLVEVGYGELDEHGILKGGTFRYSSEGSR